MPVTIHGYNGNVGIGTSSPDAILDVEKSHTDYTTSFMRLTNPSANANNSNFFCIKILYL